jgi:SpoVK/Ycf46/Vps4 family AAA+-type ATPase
MDGFSQNSAVIVLAATNNPQDVDAALKRPGRFDNIVEVPLPDKDRRKAIVQHYVHKIPPDKIHSIDTDRIAEKTYGLNNAELKEMVRVACLQAVQENAAHIEQRHFDSAVTKIKAQKNF